MIKQIWRFIRLQYWKLEAMQIQDEISYIEFFWSMPDHHKDRNADIVLGDLRRDLEEAKAVIAKLQK